MTIAHTNELMVVPVRSIRPCPYQPRVNVSVDLVRQLAASMRAGRHQPLLEVERLSGESAYQIVCGEQRWRAAREAGLDEVLVRVHPALTYLERLQKQYEENHLRADLDVVEEAHLTLLAKTLRDVAVAERLLRDAGEPFVPLDGRVIDSREGFVHHLDELRERLAHRRIRTALSPWRETEKALGISETTRKSRIGILRLDVEVRERVRGMPAEHGIQISRLDDRGRQLELAGRAASLTHDEVETAVRRLRRDPDLSVDDALAVASTEQRELQDPLRFEAQLEGLADLCRQVLRTLDNLRPRVTTEQREEIAAVLFELGRSITGFGSGS
jgi:hypothetical protein